MLSYGRPSAFPVLKPYNLLKRLNFILLYFTPLALYMHLGRSVNPCCRRATLAPALTGRVLTGVLLAESGMEVGSIEINAVQLEGNDWLQLFLVQLALGDGRHTLNHMKLGLVVRGNELDNEKHF